MDFITLLEALLIQGSDELSKEVENEGGVYKIFDKVDMLFLKNVMFNDEFSKLETSIRKLSVHSRNVWTASIRVALSGQPYAAAPLLRTSLEAACYASLINDDPSLAETWINRHVDKQSELKSRKSFGPAVAKVAERIATVSPELGENISQAYQACIDDGAHPNTNGIPRTPTMIFSAGHLEGEYDETSDFYGIPSRKTKRAISSIAYIGLINSYITMLMMMRFEELPKAEIEEVRSDIELLLAKI